MRSIPGPKTALVLTNHHVIKESRRILVMVNDTTLYLAAIVGADPLRDLAILRICCSTDFQAVPFGDASNLSPGAEVVAIGYPRPDVLGAFDIDGGPTVTRGIISAIRDVSIFIGDEPFEGHVIQTDSAINPGNSGGPLLTGSGEVVGINTFGILSAESLGFAVSEKTISLVLPGLITGSQGTIWTAPTALGSPTSFHISQDFWYTVTVPGGWTIDHSDDYRDSENSKDGGSVVMWHPNFSSAFSMDIHISFEKIDIEKYPTLTQYIADNPPRGPAGEEPYFASQEPRRTDSQVSFVRFDIRYGTPDSFTRSLEHWYPLGNHLARVSATAT